MDKNLWKMVGAGASVSGDIEQATKGDFRIKDGVITKYIGKKVKFRLPDGIKEIGEDAFSLNDDIDTVIIPEGVTKLHDSAFATCRGLVQVVLPSTLKSIGDGAFMFCNLTSMDLPNGLEEIGAGAFQNCRNIHEMTVPESVNRIGYAAFFETGVSLFSFFSEEPAEGATIRLPENFRTVIDENNLGSDGVKFVYYGRKTRYISKYQNPVDEDEDEDVPVSPLSGQTIRVSGKTYDHTSLDFFPKLLKLILPDGYRLDKDYNDEGETIYTIRGGLKYNDEGEETSAFTSGFMDVNVNIDDRDKLVKEGKLKEKYVPGMLLDFAAESMLDSLREQFGEGKILSLHESYPAASLIKLCQPVSLFGITINTYIIMVMIEISEDSVFAFQTVYTENEDGNQEFFNHLLNIIKAYRVSGKPVDTGTMTGAELERLLNMDIDEDREALSLNMNLGINLKLGDEETQFMLNGDGSITENKVDTALEYATPDESLYPHYNTMLRTQGLGLFGATIVVNQTGTEYKFYNLAEDLDEDASVELRNAVAQLSDSGASKYKLADRAVEMRSVFHVSPDVFDSAHDRECELAEGYMHRAYMMSALRSFAWTLAKYCEALEIKPEEMTIDQIHKIIDGVADLNWLNYDDKSVCKGLCGTQDLHVYYLPDKTPERIKAVFRPSQETIDQTKQMQDKFPTYNPILDQIGSLDKLRKDLGYIYPAIEKIYDDVLENRDYNEPLVSRDGDILYAWCALAYAARGPFYSEDGPTSCWFSQMDTKQVPRKRSNASAKTVTPSAKGKVLNPPQNTITKWNFQTAAIPDKKKGLIDNSNGYPIRFLPRSEVIRFGQTEMAEFQHYCALHNPEFKGKVDILLEKANKYLTLFAEDGTDIDIKSGRLKNSAPIHALRSLLWTAVELQESKFRSTFPSNAPADMWMDLARFIYDKGFTNYKHSRKDDTRFGAEVLLNMEVRYIYTDVCRFVFEDCYKNKALGRTMINSERFSLFKLVDTLLKIMPVMDLYYEKATGPEDVDAEIIESIKMIIKGWSAFAFAIKQPFYVVPGDRYPIDIEPDLVPNWSETPIKKDCENGLFTSYGNEIVEVNNTIQQQTVRIPDGITGFVVDSDNKDSINRAFSNVKKIILPSTYKGRIIVPGNVEEIEVLGDIDLLHLKDLAPDGVAPSLKKIEFKGKVSEIGTYAFNFLKNIKTLKLPEGLITINSSAFTNTELNELYLPESLKMIPADSIGSLPPDKGTTIYVYKSCPALSKIQKQLNDLQNELKEREKRWGYSTKPFTLRLKTMDSPWVTRARAFVTRINWLYDDSRVPDITAESVKAILEETIGNYDDFIKCKDTIVTEAAAKKRLYLADLIKKSRDDQQLFDTLPDQLSKDINAHIKTKNREEKEKKLAEIKQLYQSDKLSDLDRGISILEGLQKDGEDADSLIKLFNDKIEDVKAAGYAEAEALAAEQTESSINAALSKIRAISPYKDSSSKIMEYTKLLEMERKYTTAVSSMQDADSEALKQVKKNLVELGDYKDSKDKVAECDKQISSIESVVNEKSAKAKALIEAGDPKSLIKAEGIYSELRTIDKNVDQQRTYGKMVTKIRDLRKANIELEKLREEHDRLKGLFKKKERLALEKRISDTEMKRDAIMELLKTKPEADPCSPGDDLSLEIHYETDPE